MRAFSFHFLFLFCLIYFVFSQKKKKTIDWFYKINNSWLCYIYEFTKLLVQKEDKLYST